MTTSVEDVQYLWKLNSQCWALPWEKDCVWSNTTAETCVCRGARCVGHICTRIFAFSIDDKSPVVVKGKEDSKYHNIHVRFNELFCIVVALSSCPCRHPRCFMKKRCLRCSQCRLARHKGRFCNQIPMLLLGCYKSDSVVHNVYVA
jgi:hypothetical protein